MSGRSAKAARRLPVRAKQDEERAKQRRKSRLTSGLAVVLALVAAAVLYHFVGQNNTKVTSAASGSSSYPYAVGTPGIGQPAPPVSLPSTTGGAFDLARYRGKQQVLLYFQEGLTCQPCWDQIATIQKDRAKFAALGIGPIVSVTTDPLHLIKQKASDNGLTIPVLADDGATVSDSYNARSFGMMGHDRDGHTFVLVGKNGRIVWRADYGGAPKYTMFVPDDELLTQLRTALKKPA